MFTRNKNKGFYVDLSLLENTDPKKVIKTKSRSSTIIPQMIGRVYQVHNGKKYISITINENMIKHKLGEFAPTRVVPKHKLKKVVNTRSQNKK